jgi:N-acetylmuramoyl-L-alanine amidase
MRTYSIFLLVSFVTVLTLSSFVVNNDEREQSEKFIVVLDAGHGGKDPGNLGNGYKEKDIALSVTLKVGEELEKKPNIKVIYTRKTDVFIELKDRPRIANKAKADLFVSIHCNAHKTQASGTETFVLAMGNAKQNFEVAKMENEVIFLEEDYEKHYAGFNPNSPESLLGVTLSQEEFIDQSILLASLIEKEASNVLKRKSRGVKQASLWVIHQTAMPSVLIELGFLTNNEEGAYLNSKRGQDDMSTSIANAILKYKKSLDFNFDESGLSSEPLNEIKPKEPIVTIKNPDIEFKVQIAASSKDLITKPYNFKGLENISKVKEGGVYKYFYGATSDYNAVKKLETQAKNLGYTTCFIVAFKEGQKIPLSEALKTTAN